MEKYLGKKKEEEEEEEGGVEEWLCSNTAFCWRAARLHGWMNPLWSSVSSEGGSIVHALLVAAQVVPEVLGMPRLSSRL